MTAFPLNLTNLQMPFARKKRRKGLEDEYRGLVGRLMAAASSTDRAPMVGVTACSHGDGTTTIATNLAAAAGRALDGFTLLIDGHAERPSVEELFGLGAGPGVAGAITGRLSIPDCIQRTQVPRLLVMGPGDEMAAIGYQRPDAWNAFVTSLRTPFKLVFVDLPPVPKLRSQPAMLQALDGVLLVVRAERTRRKVAQYYRDLLVRVNPTVLGVVLNGRKNHVPNWLYQRI